MQKTEPWISMPYSEFLELFELSKTLNQIIQENKRILKRSPTKAPPKISNATKTPCGICEYNQAPCTKRGITG